MNIAHTSIPEIVVNNQICDTSKHIRGDGVTDAASGKIREKVERTVTQPDKIIITNNARGSRFEIPDLLIPALEFPENGRTMEASQIIHIHCPAIPNLMGELTFSRVKERPTLLSVTFIGYIDTVRVFPFSDSLFKSKEKGKPEYAYWHSGHRQVNELYTGKGVGEFIMLFREELIKRISQKYPDFRGDYMEVLTDIAAVANLLIDQNWLEEHGLEQFQKKHGVDLGYVPETSDVVSVKNLLDSHTTRLGQIRREGEPPIKFVKSFRRVDAEDSAGAAL